MATWIKSMVFRRTELGFMWWQHVIDYPCKSFDNLRTQELAFR